ncbi:MAG: hypothetical protein AAF617_17520, partial [Bacteroidota bacterium]
MKRVLLSILICFFLKLSFGQESSKKSYLIFDSNHKILIEDLVYEEILISAEKGIMIFKFNDMETEATLQEFSAVSIAKSKFENNILEKTLLKDRLIFQINSMGKSMRQVDSSLAENKTIKFKKLDKNNWKILNSDQLTPVEKEYAEEELFNLNNALEN